MKTKIQSYKRMNTIIFDLKNEGIKQRH